MPATYVTDVAFGEESITTTVTSSGAAVEGWVDEVYSQYGGASNETIVGLDVEWRPSYSRVDNPTALLQLCVDNRCLIFQVLHTDYIPNDLLGFLMDDQFRFVGVGVDEDVVRLDRDCGLQVSNLEDLRGVAAEVTGSSRFLQAGLSALAQQIMGVSIEKPRRIRMGPWDAYRLSGEQVRYACIDAYVSGQVGLILLNGDY